MAKTRPTMAERSAQLGNKENIYENITSASDLKNISIKKEDDLVKYNLSISNSDLKYLKQKALDQNTSVRTLIIQAIEQSYPELKK